MNPWIIVLVIGAAVIFLLDYLVRRKKWNGNTKAEKISLVLNMITAPCYVFLSLLGILWEIVAGDGSTAFGQVICDATMMMGRYYWIVAIAAVVSSLVLRKKSKVKASIWVNVIAVLYIVAALGLNSLADSLL